MAQTVELSPAHFSRMFRKSTGETPHQFVLRNRIERAKEMLRAPEARVLDVAVACGFKTRNTLRECSVMCVEPALESIGWNGDPVVDLNSATVQILEQSLSRSCNSGFGQC